MYKKILAAVNEHLNSEVSARYALELAKVTGSKIYLCYIAEKGVSEKAFKQTEETVKRLFLRAEDTGLRAESIFDTGDPVAKIGGIVETEKINIVFASTRREDVQKRFYAGTIARKLSLNLPCSVALVRVVHMGRIHPKKILVPLKAKLDHIDERAYFTSMVAEAFGSNIFLFHTTKPAKKFFHGELHLTPVEWEEKLPGDISHFIEHLNRYKVTHEKRLVPGRTGRHITIEAAAKRFDLVIMGASERSLLRSIFRGNPVEEVLRETPCDLIILKARYEDKQPH
jgi:nucleotide-binding universal stress UspA family protein